MDNTVIIIIIGVIVCCVCISSSIFAGTLMMRKSENESESETSVSSSSNLALGETSTPVKSSSTDSAKPTSYPYKYYFAKDCPNGWEDKGTIGFPARNTMVDKSPFTKGGEYNNEWTWIHPKLCYGQANPSNMQGLYKFTKNVKTDLPELVILSQKSNPVPGEFVKAGELNPEWEYAYPYLMNANEKNGYTVSSNDSGKGKTGILFNNSKTSPFDLGGGYHPDWRWTHPFLESD
jgi:hypothetical protein